MLTVKSTFAFEADLSLLAKICLVSCGRVHLAAQRWAKVCWANSESREQQWYVGEQWEVRRIKAICSEYFLHAPRSNGERETNHRPASIYVVLELTCSFSSRLTSHPTESRTLCPCDPASYRKSLDPRRLNSAIQNGFWEGVALHESAHGL